MFEKMHIFFTPIINMKSEPQIEYRGPPPQDLRQDNCQIEEWSPSFELFLHILSRVRGVVFFFLLVEFKKWLFSPGC